jgi:hypothetical protein
MLQPPDSEAETGTLIPMKMAALSIDVCFDQGAYDNELRLYLCIN